MRETTMIRGAAMAAVLVIATGCAANKRVAQNAMTFCAKSSATLYVQNDNWLDIVLYAVHGTSRYRLGQVSSVNSAKFEIPTGVIGAGGGLYILADPIGVVSAQMDRAGHMNMFATDDIQMAPGHTIIEIRLDNIIDHSSYTVSVEDPEEG